MTVHGWMKVSDILHWDWQHGDSEISCHSKLAQSRSLQQMAGRSLNLEARNDLDATMVCTSEEKMGGKNGDC